MSSFLKYTKQKKAVFNQKLSHHKFITKPILTEIKVRKSCIDLPYNQRSTMKPQNHKIDYCAICSISTNLFPIPTNVSVIRNYAN